MGHILMDNRNGLVVDVEITHANGTAEHQAALKMLGRQRRRGRKQTVGADKNYDCKAFVQGCPIAKALNRVSQVVWNLSPASMCVPASAVAV